MQSRKIASSVLGGVLTVGLMSSPSWSGQNEQLDVFNIMQKVDEFDDGDNVYTLVDMAIIDRFGKRAEFQMKQYRKYSNADRDVRFTRSFFSKPIAANGVSVLSHDHKDTEKQDDRWMYIPKLKATKRITSDEVGSVMGSDISYADLNTRKTEDYSYEYLGEEQVKEWDTWKIEFVPKSAAVEKKFGYTKGVVYVDKSTYLVVRAAFWMVNEQNKLKFYDLNRMENISGIWTPVDMVFYTKRSGKLLKTTEMKLADVEYNATLPLDFFSTDRLSESLDDAGLGEGG